MNKILYCSLFLCLIPAVVFGQQSMYHPYNFNGSVTLNGLELAERGGSLYLSMDIHVRGEAVNKRQSWTVAPVLSDGRNTLQMPCMLINGRVKEQHYKRSARFRGQEQVSGLPVMKTDIPYHTDTVLRYALSVPYEPWMDNASLTLNQVLSSSADKRQLFTSADIKTVALEPRVPYEVAPAYSFLMPEAEQKRRRMQGQAYLDFQVGRSVILPNYRRNPEELAKINEAISKIQENADVRIIGLFIEGYASPDGSYALNERLSYERALAFKDYMLRTYNMHESIAKVSSVAEDWSGLRVLVEGSDIARKDQVLAIIDSDMAPDTKEQRIKALGTPWRTISGDMLPQLRRVEYQIDFSVKDYTKEESRVLAKRNPEMLSQRELFTLAVSYPEGSAERENIFDIIYRQYPDDSTALINQAGIMLSRGEVQGAKRLLDRVSDDARSWNNLGVYHLKTGDLEKAYEYLSRAIVMGSQEAEHNLEELSKKQESNKQMARYRNR